MLLLIIIIILLSIYIIKSDNIKTAIKKDIEKIIPNNQHQHEKAQGEQNSQTDINTKDITTEIRTSFLKILDIFKTYYYKLKNTAKEYLKEISINKNIQDNIKHKDVQKPVDNVPQYNQLYQHNEEPNQYKVNELDKTKKSSSKIAYIISFIVSLIASFLGYYLTYYCVLQYITNSYSEFELDYYAYTYGDAYAYYIIGQSIDTMSLIYKIVIGATIALVIGTGYCYLGNDKSKNKFWIVVFAAIGIFLGTFIFNQTLLSEI